MEIFWSELKKPEELEARVSPHPMHTSTTGWLLKGVERLCIDDTALLGMGRQNYTYTIISNGKNCQTGNLGRNFWNGKHFLSKFVSCVCLNGLSFGNTNGIP